MPGTLPVRSPFARHRRTPGPGEAWPRIAPGSLEAESCFRAALADGFPQKCGGAAPSGRPAGAASGFLRGGILPVPGLGDVGPRRCQPPQYHLARVMAMAGRTPCRGAGPCRPGGKTAAPECHAAAAARQSAAGYGTRPGGAGRFRLRHCPRLPADATIYHRRGVALAALFRKAEALQDFDRALALAPDSQTRIARAIMLHGLHRLPEALAAFRQAAAADPGNAPLQMGLAHVAMEAGEDEVSVAAFDQAYPSVARICPCCRATKPSCQAQGRRLERLRGGPRGHPGRHRAGRSRGLGPGHRGIHARPATGLS